MVVAKAVVEGSKAGPGRLSERRARLGGADPVWTSLDGIAAARVVVAVNAATHGGAGGVHVASRVDSAGRGPTRVIFLGVNRGEGHGQD